MEFFGKITIFWGFSRFFQQRYIGNCGGFLRCNHCFLALHLIYQTQQSDDFQILAYNGFLQIFRHLVQGGGVSEFFGIFFVIFLSS